MSESTIVGRSILVDMTQAQYEALERLAINLGTTVSEIVRELIAQIVTQSNVTDTTSQ